MFLVDQASPTADGTEHRNTDAAKSAREIVGDARKRISKCVVCYAHARQQQTRGKWAMTMTSNGDDEIDDLRAWAAQVAACVDSQELSALIRDYRRIARNKAVDSESRKLARMQAKALSEQV